MKSAKSILVVATVIVGLVHSNLVGQVVHPNIIHQWSAEGDATDSVSNADGVMNGDVDFADGVWGQAFDFNGGHVDFGNIPDTNFGTADFTISLWIKTSTDDGWYAIVNKRAVCTQSSFWSVRYLTPNDYCGGNIIGELYQPVACVAAPGTLDEQWHHIVFMRDAGMILMYFDGNGSSNYTSSNMSNNASLIAGIDVCESHGTLPLIGRIDELQIYNRALSQIEVEELFINPPPCSADFNDDDIVDAADMAVLLGFWGMNDPMFGDVDNDGDVDAADLALLLGSWGPC